MIRLEKIPDDVLEGEILDKVKLYDADEFRLEQIWNLTRIFNEHHVTTEKICGLCNREFQAVINEVRKELQKRNLL